MLTRRKLYFVGLFIVSIFVAGCQSKVYLMPLPAGIEPGDGFFDLSQDTKDDNLLYTFYATNRQPIDSASRSDHYSIFPSQTLKMGYVVHRIGDEKTSWEEIYEESLKKKRNQDLLLTREYTREVLSYSIEDDLKKTSPEADGFLDDLNKTLDKTIDKDILVYVHGANSNFYRATAQGAQFFHFTGHNSIVITFSWPSAENILKYKIDVMHADETVPAFSRLIELLATHTKAKNINILAYSAGALVAAPGLAHFRDLYPELTTEELKQKLRIGEVYFAAPDAEFKSFAERYLKFKDIVGRTTLNINENDSVLKISAFQNGMSRLGRPDVTEVSDEELKILIDASKTPQLNVIDVGGSESLQVGRAHDSWYNHPWVSSDVLMLLLFNADPLDRGLDEHWYEDRSEGYQFPADYESRLAAIFAEQKEELIEKLKSESGD